MKRNYGRSHHRKAGIMHRKSHILKDRALVWIIGDSLLMDGIAASFEEQLLEKPVRMAMVEPNMNDRLHSSKPNLIIFELDTPGAYLLLETLREHPGIQLLGIDQNCARVILLNSMQRPTRTMKELIDIVQEAAGFGEGTPEGGE